jgi:hypothetical protein
MSVLPLILAASLLLVTAAYAQFQIPRYTAGRSAVWLTRALLIATGSAFGYVAAITYSADPALATLAFLVAFGAVHFPAAFILFVKRERGSGKS